MRFLSFFFQAEEGIREADVTGVQTCALPISPARLMKRYRSGAEAGGVRDYRESANELTAVSDALALADPGDCIVIMAQEHVEAIRDLLDGSATPASQ